jgi:pimeloyl-ACP methyl ester carboxylesterase
VTATVSPSSAASARTAVAVEGVRFALDRYAPARRRRTTPVLLLHGVPQTARVWRPIAADLGRDRVALAPDLKGLGESELRGPYDIDTLVAELAALVLHEVDGPVDVVGHDWGGSLALALSAARPDLVRRLVVINAPFRSIDLRRAWHIPLFSMPLLPNALFTVAGRRIVNGMFDYAWRASAPLPASDREFYVDAYSDPRRVAAMLSYYRSATGRRVRAAAQKAMRRERDVPAAPRPDAALVIWGAADPVLPLSIAEGIVADLGDNARLISLPGVGHFPVDEAPELVHDAVAEFLRAASVELK